MSSGRLQGATIGVNGSPRVQIQTQELLSQPQHQVQTLTSP